MLGTTHTQKTSINNTVKTIKKAETIIWEINKAAIKCIKKYLRLKFKYINNDTRTTIVDKHGKNSLKQEETLVCMQ